MKKVIKTLILGLAVILVTGCTWPFGNEDDNYSTKLASLFPEKEGTSANYFGLAEYGHVVEIANIKKTDKTLIYEIEGYFNDAKGDDPSIRQFEITYTIDKDSIKEVIVNKDELRAEGKDDTLNSIVPNQIIMKLPLEVGTSWTQKFTYKGQEYTATTKITKIIEGTEGNKQYTTKFTIDDIEGFFDNEYYEERTYEVGKGLIKFANTMEEYDIEGLDRELTQEDFLFGYTQGTITEK